MNPIYVNLIGVNHVKSNFFWGKSFKPYVYLQLGEQEDWNKSAKAMVKSKVKAYRLSTLSPGCSIQPHNQYTITLQ